MLEPYDAFTSLIFSVAEIVELVVVGRDQKGADTAVLQELESTDEWIAARPGGDSKAEPVAEGSFLHGVGVRRHLDGHHAELGDAGVAACQTRLEEPRVAIEGLAARDAFESSLE